MPALKNINPKLHQGCLRSLQIFGLPIDLHGKDRNTQNSRQNIKSKEQTSQLNKCLMLSCFPLIGFSLVDAKGHLVFLVCQKLTTLTVEKLWCKLSFVMLFTFCAVMKIEAAF